LSRLGRFAARRLCWRGTFRFRAPDQIVLPDGHDVYLNLPDFGECRYTSRTQTGQFDPALMPSYVSVYLGSPVWWARVRFRNEVDGFIPRN
jgi:hypothetical protein